MSVNRLKAKKPSGVVMSSAEPPEHEIWNEETKSPDGVGELRPQRPVEE